MASAPTCSYAFFPFLKTSGSFRLGRFEFKSTEDCGGLDEEQRRAVAELREMLFWRDNLRLKSSTFAIVPLVDADRPYDGPSGRVLGDLAVAQALIAYLYGEPHEVFGDPFLSSEHATMLVFTRASVIRGLVFPDGNVESVVAMPPRSDSEPPHVLGYHGIYNFRDQFWVTSGSRVPPPLAHMTLNHSQDLALDFHHQRGALVDLVLRDRTVASERVLIAVRWFNESTAAKNDDAAALVDLAIAFEALLGIPADSKTDRFVDAVSLLLGRGARIDVWARQFYDARSNVVHEGRIRQLRFVATDSAKRGADGQLYHSLLAVGRGMFRLCLRTLVEGARLAAESGLQEKLTTNKERFDLICRVLGDSSAEPRARLLGIASTAQAIHDYKWISETGLTTATVIAAIRLAAQAMLDVDPDLPVELAKSLRAFLAASRTDDEFERLEALLALDQVVTNKALVPERRDPWGPAIQLIEDSWMICMWHYYRLERRRASAEKEK